MTAIRKLGAIKSLEEFRRYLGQVGADLPLDDRLQSAAEGSPLGWPMRFGTFTVGNRWAIQPMEGWDGTDDGRPTEPVFRRWRRFGESGAKLIWGGEAFAVRRDGRANPRQLYYATENISAMRELHHTLVRAHIERFGSGAADDLLVGLQLTHSGRFSRPNYKDRPEPLAAYHHPLLDIRVGGTPPLLTDAQLERLTDDYAAAARAAQEAGFGFVDIKACHGYIVHELLSAFERPGRYGGDFAGRTRFLRETIARVRDSCPGLLIGVRLSLFDLPPFTALGPQGPWRGFGSDAADPMRVDLTEPIRLLRELRHKCGVAAVNLTAGSPYYNPHIQRPAYYPPSDGYPPPEDPLIGCARQMQALRTVKGALPGLPVVGSAYSYFQEFLPHIAQASVREGWTDFVGIGRLVLSYPELPADVLEGRPLRIKKICRTFSDCTTAPRHGLPSGCYPLDDYYKDSSEAQQLRVVKLGRPGGRAGAPAG